MSELFAGMDQPKGFMEDWAYAASVLLKNLDGTPGTVIMKEKQRVFLTRPASPDEYIYGGRL